MADLNNINVTLTRSNFDITVKKIDGKLTVTDPITVKNQISEIHGIADIPNVNAVSVVDGSMIIYNANNALYEIRPLNILTNLTVSNTIVLSHLSANGSIGANGDILASNGSYVYWTPLSSGDIQGVIAGDGLSGGGTTGTVTLSVNSAYISTLTSNNAYYANNATYAYGKQEEQLSVANAVFAHSSNNSLYAYGKQENQINANNAQHLVDAGWKKPGAIGTTTPNTAVFTTISHSGLVPTFGTNIDQVYNITDTREITTDWQDTNINDSLLPIGSYFIQMITPLEEVYTGIMSWYSSNTVSGAGDEILLHRAVPDDYGTIFLRVYRSEDPEIDMVLQIASTGNREYSPYVYNFRRMI